MATQAMELLLPVLARCIYRANHPPPDTPVSEIIHHINSTLADVGNMVQSRGYEIMTQAVNYYSSQLSLTHVIILNDTIKFLDQLYNETTEIKQFRLNRLRAVGLLSAIECRVLQGLPT